MCVCVCVCVCACKRTCTPARDETYYKTEPAKPWPLPHVPKEALPVVNPPINSEEPNDFIHLMAERQQQKTPEARADLEVETIREGAADKDGAAPVRPRKATGPKSAVRRSKAKVRPKSALKVRANTENDVASLS